MELFQQFNYAPKDVRHHLLQKKTLTNVSKVQQKN